MLIKVFCALVTALTGGGGITIQLHDSIFLLIVLSASGRTNVELREQLSRPEGVTQTMGSFTSRRVSEQKSTVVADKPPAGPGRKPRLDVPSSGYGMRREKSGELRPRREKSGELKPPSGPPKQRSGTSLKGTAEKSFPGKKTSVGSRVKKTDSQTSLGSTGSLEDSSEASSPRVSSGIPSSPTSSTSSRGSPDRPSSAASKSPGKGTGLSRSRENVRSSRESLHKPKEGARGSTIPTSKGTAKSPGTTKARNGEEKKGAKK